MDSSFFIEIRGTKAKVLCWQRLSVADQVDARDAPPLGPIFFVVVVLFFHFHAVLGKRFTK